MNPSLRTVLCAAVALGLVRAQEPPTPPPAPEPPPPAPSARPATPAPELPPAPDLWAGARWLRSKTEPGLPAAPAPEARSPFGEQEDPNVVAARRLSALFDRGRLEAEATEATGLRRRTMGKLVDTLVRDRVPVQREDRFRIVLPEAGLVVSYDGGRSVTVTALDPTRAESLRVREQAALKNAYDVLPPTAREPFARWWTEKKAAVDAAANPFHAALRDFVARSAAPTVAAPEATAPETTSPESTADSEVERERDAVARNRYVDALTRSAAADEAMRRAEVERKFAATRAAEVETLYARARDARAAGDVAAADAAEADAANARTEFEAAAKYRADREADLKSTVEALTRARTEMALGAERAERFARIEAEVAAEERKRALDLYAEGVKRELFEDSRSDERLRALLAETRPDAESLRSAAADAVRQEALKARRLADTLRAQADDDVKRAQDKAAWSKVEATRGDELRLLREEIQALRAEVEALRAARRGPR